MKSLSHYIILMIIILFYNCDASPQAIDYGNDGCHYCKMTIVDKIHGAEVVTQKGKVYKFDAMECLVNFSKTFNTSEIKHYLTNNYTDPEILIDATEATFLISNSIPSPMGAFLTAFKTKEDALEIQVKKEGSLYTWEELLIHLK